MRSTAWPREADAAVFSTHPKGSAFHAPIMTAAAHDQLRPVRIERGFIRNSPGSVLYRSGETAVLVTASLSDTVPPFLEGKGGRLADRGIRDAARQHALAQVSAGPTAAPPRSSG